MANQQTSTSKRGEKATQSSGSRAGAAGRSSAASSTASANGTKVERDETYGLISVLYHALQGAETYTQYIEDARRANDDELRTFFEECRTEENGRAKRARQLLASRLDEDEEEDDEDEDEEDDEDEDEEDVS